MNPEDTNPVKPSKKTYRRRLARIKDIRLALANVYRQLEQDQIESNKARTMVYILNSLAEIMDSRELEKRLDGLEAKLRKAERQSEPVSGLNGHTLDLVGPS